MSENIFELVLKKFDVHVSSKFIICYFENSYTLFAFEMDFLELLLHFCLPTLEIQTVLNVLKDYDVQKCKGCFTELSFEYLFLIKIKLFSKTLLSQLNGDM